MFRPFGNHRTRRVDRGQADVPLEIRLTGWCQVDDVECTSVGQRVGCLNGRVAEDSILAEGRVAGACGDVDPLGVPSYGVVIDDIP